MTLEILLFLGVIFNVAAALVSRGLKVHATGVDSLPAVPIIAGVAYGPAEGALAGLVVSIAYYIAQPGGISYAPITVVMNILVGFLAHFLAFAGIFGAGIALLVLYHVVSGIVISLFGGFGARYFAFVILNFLTTVVLLLLAS